MMPSLLLLFVLKKNSQKNTLSRPLQFDCAQAAFKFLLLMGSIHPILR